jgi:hypothetical protein
MSTVHPLWPRVERHVVDMLHGPLQLKAAWQMQAQKCTPVHYSTFLLQQLYKCRKAAFLGDSIARNMAETFSNMLGKHVSWSRHKDHNTKTPNNTQVDHFWASHVRVSHTQQSRTTTCLQLQCCPHHCTVLAALRCSLHALAFVAQVCSGLCTGIFALHNEHTTLCRCLNTQGVQPAG